MFGKKHSEKTKEKMSRSAYKRSTLEYRMKLSLARRGEKNPLYIHGRGYKNDTERSKIMRMPKYRFWRQSVFERDNYTCQMCGERGGKLRADHIKPFATYEELRFDINNGRTLCDNCHRKTPTYGGRMSGLKVEVNVNQI